MAITTSYPQAPVWVFAPTNGWPTHILGQPIEFVGVSPSPGPHGEPIIMLGDKNGTAWLPVTIGGRDQESFGQADHTHGYTFPDWIFGKAAHIPEWQTLEHNAELVFLPGTPDTNQLPAVGVIGRETGCPAAGTRFFIPTEEHPRIYQTNQQISILNTSTPAVPIAHTTFIRTLPAGAALPPIYPHEQYDPNDEWEDLFALDEWALTNIEGKGAALVSTTHQAHILAPHWPIFAIDPTANEDLPSIMVHGNSNQSPVTITVGPDGQMNATNDHNDRVRVTVTMASPDLPTHLQPQPGTVLHLPAIQPGVLYQVWLPPAPTGQHQNHPKGVTVACAKAGPGTTVETFPATAHIP